MEKEHRCVLVWFRRDLRLTDNPALTAALASAATVVPVYVHDADADGAWAPGAASRAWLHHSLKALDGELQGRGARLVIRRGATREVLPALVSEAGATAVFWNRLYEPARIAGDRDIAQTLRRSGIATASFNAALWAEPSTLGTASGTPYRVFTPFWRALSAVLPGPTVESAPEQIPTRALPSDALDSLGLQPRIGWDLGFWRHWQPGETGAITRLQTFLDTGLRGYRERRDRPADAGISRLSPHLHFGEIGPRQILAVIRGAQAGDQVPEADAEHFLRELGWREFAHHLLFHYPQTPTQPLDPAFAQFPWRKSRDYADDLRAWQRGETGVPLVDAGMRELWATGWMHNRVRMVAASFLTKNLLIPWQEGARWFWDALVDADLANNTLGWQWVAGCGADAAPYFRIFNPLLQARKFDPGGDYVRRWAPDAGRGVVDPVADLAATRQRALDAYAQTRRR
ncbi:deoxyribodipyrimidine photo-lyase [Fontimonas sp. SYSU GA230001]|uniref:cryptochrome/photolyase family protein n=1 Tax=Fontimonas sp. SYSU GA230001 TaxID=3142450 RepID=UPI0032B42592